ncbi:beta-ketoacyl synthase N-terminal-like domain-containing protein, partial [Campylobacter concisus]|uniref:beta-ketoacyl synthase N-terminal-like domain-containing protein n=1 Tax=Campylobacter concisus TaxID=199 RepID=UPI0023BA1308
MHAAGHALKDAGLLNGEELQAANLDQSVQDGRMGVASGSSTGSTDSILDMAQLVLDMDSGFNANTYIKMIPHSKAANIALFYSLKGRNIPTSSPCTGCSHTIWS